jgi:phosphate transport system protein
MLRAIINLFSSDDPLAIIAEDFSRMLKVTHDMTLTAGGILFGSESDSDARTTLYKTDVEVNRLQRSLRKRLVTHLSMPGNQRDVPHCLALMSLVKDVERLGDYAKNLAEIPDIHPEPLPEDEMTSELKEIRAGVESTFSESLAVVARFDHDRAISLIEQGRGLTRRCEALVHRVAHSSYDAGNTAAVVLGARFYKRIAGHVLNVLSAVVMPLHKLDYYDENAVTLRRDADDD